MTGVSGIHSLVNRIVIYHLDTVQSPQMQCIQQLEGHLCAHNKWTNFAI